MSTEGKPQTVSADGYIVVDPRSPREKVWDKFTTIPLIILSFVFLLAYSILILDDQPMMGALDRPIVWVLIVIWVFFIIDFFVRFSLTTDKKGFIPRNILDFLSVFIPFFRPFLLLVYLGRLRFFQGKQGSSVRARVVAYAASFAVMYIFVLSLAVFAAERHAPGASITSYGDSIWWSFETISTVGYGDMVPVTVPGRVYAVLLMLGGMIIVGATTATVISYLSERIQQTHRRNQLYAQTHHAGQGHPHDSGHDGDQHVDGKNSAAQTKS